LEHKPPLGQRGAVLRHVAKADDEVCSAELVVNERIHGGKERQIPSSLVACKSETSRQEKALPSGSVVKVFVSVGYSSAPLIVTARYSYCVFGQARKIDGITRNGSAPAGKLDSFHFA
jgi:hypothetical protein